jgi:hypothetical protein
MVQLQRRFDDGEGGVLGEGVEPDQTHPSFPSGGGDVRSRALDGTKDKKLLVEAEIDPLHHVGVGEAADDDRFAPTILVDDFERLAESGLGGGLGISHFFVPLTLVI